MTAINFAATTTSEPTNQDISRVKTLFLVIAFLTIFDGLASWISIEYLGIAAEGNGGLDFISGIVGFGGAMIVRVIWGISATLLLASLAIKFKTEKMRMFSTRGLWFIALALLALMAYQIVIMGMGLASWMSL